VLSEYADDAWCRRIVSGAEVGNVECWLAGIEARPRLPGPVSGKPLAWLQLTVESRPGRMQTLRSVGLLSDVLRVLDRKLTAKDLQDLVSIFDRSGRPFKGTVDAPAP
jgi:hypothetical protein